MGDTRLLQQEQNPLLGKAPHHVLHFQSRLEEPRQGHTPIFIRGFWSQRGYQPCWLERHASSGKPNCDGRDGHSLVCGFPGDRRDR